MEEQVGRALCGRQGVGRGLLRLASLCAEGPDEISLAMGAGDVVESDPIGSVTPTGTPPPPIPLLLAGPVRGW